MGTYKILLKIFKVQIDSHSSVCACVCAKSFQSCLLRPVASWEPLSMGFSRQEYWSELPCPPPGDRPDPLYISYIFCTGRQVLYH